MSKCRRCPTLGPFISLAASPPQPFPPSHTTPGRIPSQFCPSCLFPTTASQASKASIKSRGSAAVGSRPRIKDPILAPKMDRHHKCIGRVLRDSMECERSRKMSDAFRPPSPSPFAVVTEPAPLWERERVVRKARFRVSTDNHLLGMMVKTELIQSDAIPANT